MGESDTELDTHGTLKLSRLSLPRMPLMRIVVLLICGVFFWTTRAGAYPESHPPFPAGKSTPYPTLTAEAVLGYAAEVPFEEGLIRISTSPEREKVGRVTEVLVNGQLIFDTATANPDFYFQVGSRVFYSDLTGDHRKDILILSYPGANGLGAWIEMADLLIAKADGTYKHTSFEAFAAGPEDFIDVNGDGRYKMLWVNYYFEGDHSYWVYRVVEIGDDGLRLNDQLIPGFPKIIWFTEKPNDQPSQRLTGAQREDLIRQSTAKWQGSNQ